MQLDFNHIDTYDYELPEELIAKTPLPNRTESRLLHCDVQQNSLTDRVFSDIEEWLQPGDVLVLNNTKVIPARFFGQKETGGKIEGLIERIMQPTVARVHLKSSNAPKEGAILILDGGLQVKMIGRHEELFVLEIIDNSEQPHLNWLDYLDTFGHIPLPPYIDREDQPADKERYQCVFHDPNAPGAVAAPTAGLHFDEPLLERIKAKGVHVVYITLHVGAGTFKPVSTDNLDEHLMHSEWCAVTQDVADLINATKQNNTGRILAVGTTCVRTLESAVNDNGNLIAFMDNTNLFIRPGFKFNIIDALITNFHLPKSTLLVLICALGGYDLMMRAYFHAINDRYRFFSYGDAMLIES